MAGKRRFDDMELALLLADGRTHQECADELGVSRVAVSKRIKKLKETNPYLLEGTTVDKFRSNESDQVAKARQYILNAVMQRVTSPKGLNRESLPQLIKAFAILWDKDEKIQDRVALKEDVIRKIEYSPEELAMIKKLMGLKTQQALEEARKEEAGTGDSVPVNTASETIKGDEDAKVK